MLELNKNNDQSFQLAPPPISEDDARKGILSLIERGLIPPAAQLTLDPSPVKNKLVLLHAPHERQEKGKTPGMGDEYLHNYSKKFKINGRKLLDFDIKIKKCW